MLAALTAPQFGVVLPVVGALLAGANDLFGDVLDEGLLERFDTPREAVGALALVLGLALLVSFGAALVAFAGFEVEREGDRLRIRRGLFQRRVATVQVARIDGVAIVEGLLRAPFGLATVRLETASSRKEESAARTLFPLVRLRDVPGLLAELVPGLDGHLPLLDRPPARSLRRYVTAPALLGAVVGVGLGVATGGLGWLAAPALLAAGTAQGVAGFRAAGLHLGPERVVLRARRGTARVTLLARRRRLQEVSVRRTPLQRRGGVATFGLALGSGRRGRVAHLEAALADGAQAALENLTRPSGSWKGQPWPPPPEPSPAPPRT